MAGAGLALVGPLATHYKNTMTSFQAFYGFINNKMAKSSFDFLVQYTSLIAYQVQAINYKKVTGNLSLSRLFLTEFIQDILCFYSCV